MASQSAHSEGAELGRYLRARRTQTSPEHVGLTVGAGIRRTPGLRREELATLAGISIDYYVRLERGKETRPSPAVLDALARALRMDDQEHQHLRELAARAARYVSEPPPAPSRTVRPHLKLLLESLRPNPAYVISRSMDMLAWNPGGLALYAGLDDWPAKHRNLARYLFLHPAARDLFTDWDRQITACVARLRAIAGTAPDAPDLTNLVGELLLKSPDFAGLWERYEVTGRKPAHKTFQHPQVGTITLTSQSLHVEGTPGQRIGVYTAEPGTPDHDALLLLDMTAPRPAEPPAPAPKATGQQPWAACAPTRFLGRLGSLSNASVGCQRTTGEPPKCRYSVFVLEWTTRSLKDGVARRPGDRRSTEPPAPPAVGSRGRGQVPPQPSRRLGVLVPLDMGNAGRRTDGCTRPWHANSESR